MLPKDKEVKAKAKRIPITLDFTSGELVRSVMGSLLDPAVNSDVSVYLKANQPAIKLTSTVEKTYDFVWADMFEFSDGASGTLHIHMHPDVSGAPILYPGGAWIDPGAQGHGAKGRDWNQYGTTKRICVDWFNSSSFVPEGDELWKYGTLA